MILFMDGCLFQGSTKFMSNLPASEAAIAENQGLSFKAMQIEAISLIQARCLDRGMRGSRELSIRAGVSEEKANLVFKENDLSPNLPANGIVPLNGKEWDALLSAAGVSMDTWIDQCQKKAVAVADESDRVVNLVPEYGASSTAVEPPKETQKRIEFVLGFATAFYLKASNVVLPTL